VATIPVRFHQVDALGIAWHGRYVEWFEEARQVFGRKFGVDYPVFRKQNVAIPIVNLWVISPAFPAHPFSDEVALFCDALLLHICVGCGAGHTVESSAAVFASFHSFILVAVLTDQRDLFKIGICSRAY
jgi:hypothetical protein